MTNAERDKKSENHEGRIRILEKWMWGLTGAISYGLLDNFLPFAKDTIQQGIAMLPHIGLAMALGK